MANTATAREPGAGAQVLPSADVFVSYSRADRGLVASLVEGLEARGKRAWVDLENIPPSARWMAEIRTAIEAADGYLVVISPDLARSPVCREELEHAVSSGKRIVPVLVRSTDPRAVPPSLAALNWVDATDPGQLGSALDAVVTALDTDLDRVRSHTGLLVRATAWEDTAEDRSLLLRGRELSEAEFLLADLDREPRVTQLQTRFVLASRRAATRRQRGAIVIVVAAFFVAALLGIVAWQQRGAAIENERVAQRQTRLANSRAIASQALLNMDRRLDVGVLLASEAYRTAPTPEALDALHIAAQRSDWIDRTLRGPQGAVTKALYDPDGHDIASSGLGGQVVFWDPETGHIVGEPIVADDAGVSDIAFDPTGARLATAGRSGAVGVWNPGTGERAIPDLRISHQPVVSVAFSPDGGVLAAGTDGGEVALWRTRTGAQIRRAPGRGWRLGHLRAGVQSRREDLGRRIQAR